MKISQFQTLLLSLIFIGFLVFLREFQSDYSGVEITQDYLIEKIKYPDNPYNCQALLNVSINLVHQNFRYLYKFLFKIKHLY